MTGKRVLWGRGQLADTPVNDEVPDSWEDAEFIQGSDVSRQINDRGEPPPNILTPFARKIGPVYAQPSDLVTCQTFFLRGGGVDPPVQIVPSQDKGMACRVTLINVGALQVLLATDIGYLTPSVTVSGQANAFTLPGSFPQWTISTGVALFAICTAALVTNIAQLSVMIESYSPDAYNWEQWEVGQQ